MGPFEGACCQLVLRKPAHRFGKCLIVGAEFKVHSCVPFNETSSDIIHDTVPLQQRGGAAACRRTAMRLLCISGVAGLPQMTIPVLTAEGAPLGLSQFGPAYSDPPCSRPRPGSLRRMNPSAAPEPDRHSHVKSARRFPLAPNREPASRADSNSAAGWTLGNDERSHAAGRHDWRQARPGNTPDDCFISGVRSPCCLFGLAASPRSFSCSGALSARAIGSTTTRPTFCSCSCLTNGEALATSCQSD